MKRACEIAAVERLGVCATALRVGLLVGAGDYTDRLTWWVRRIDEASGERLRVPAPGPYKRYVQFIDVRDVAAFVLRCAENALGGIWNITSPPIPLSDVLDEIIRIAKSQAEIIMVEEQAVLESGIKPWTEIPLMAPIVPEFRYFLEVDTTRANSAGLNCRSLEMTLQPLLAWDRSRRNVALKGGMTPQQESLLLA
jgi:2'-hydroxyisoflavone reductase